MKQISLLIPLFLFLAAGSFSGCTSVAGVGTEQLVNSKVNGLKVGMTADQVIRHFGYQPHYVTEMRRGADVFQIWEYNLGNFTYTETIVIVFQNGRAIGWPPSAHELIKFLQWAGLTGQAEFWNSAEYREE